MKYNPHFCIMWILVKTTAASVGLWLIARDNQSTAKDDLSQALTYEILYDDMGTLIRIGVEADVNEEQLRATLVKAANEHQDDAARDYLTSMYLWVEAYLIREGQQSSVPAGRLRRYVPPGNLEERRSMPVDRRDSDSFTITLDEAARTLK